MGFEQGNQSFVICKMDRALEDDALERFSAKKAQSFQGLLDEPQTGWVSGRHLLETRIDEETSSISGFLKLQLGTAVRKIPASLFQAECRIEELALMQANKTPVLSRKQKKEIKEDVHEKLIKDMPPHISGIPFVYDKAHNMLYLGATSVNQIDNFLIYFYDTIGFEPTPLYPDFLYEKLIGSRPDNLTPLRFSPHSEKHDDELLLGRDFLMWLWFLMENGAARLEHPQYGFFSFMIDGPLNFAGLESEEGESVIRKGQPTISPEARASIFAGKKLTRAKIRLVRDQEEWQFTLDADTFSFRSMKFPDGEELDPVSHFQERMLFFEVFRSVFEQLFEDFIHVMNSPSNRSKLQDEILDWVDSMNKL